MRRYGRVPEKVFPKMRWFNIVSDRSSSSSNRRVSRRVGRNYDPSVAMVYVQDLLIIYISRMADKFWILLHLGVHLDCVWE